MNRQNAKEIDFTTEIPFDNPTTVIAAHQVAGALTFTIKAGEKLATYCASLLLTADGVNMPDFSAFGASVNADYDNTAGTVNAIVFAYYGQAADGSEIYSLSIFQPNGSATPDTTAPTITSVVAINANRIDVTFDETPVNSNGFTFTRSGSALTATSQGVFGGMTIRYGITQTLASGDVITWDYTPGNIQDAAGNTVAADSGSVTNNISGGGGVTMDSLIAQINWLNFYTPEKETTSSGGLISQIKDQKHNGGSDTNYWLINGDSSTQPSLISSGINGKQSVFVQSGKGLASAVIPSIALPLEVMMVFQPKFDPSGVTKYAHIQSNQFDFWIRLGAPGIYANGSTNLYSDTPATENSSYVMWAVYRSDGTADLYVNGVKKVDNQTFGSSTLLSSLRMGAAGSSDIGSFWISAYGVVGALSSGDRTGIINNLKTYYGV